ncbi:MAG: TM2 domain-containing protein [Clostridia bacterium]|nr:TM2 domain-containing protein [Clostridia bacterium]
METMCPKCGAPVAPNATKCEYCGSPLQQAPAAQPQNMQGQPQVIVVNNGIDTSTWPIKNKLIAILLAIFLGGIGIHEFYLGRPGKGILMILFCWTGITSVIGFIQGILMAVSNDENFKLKYRCRLQ